ncbi:MAG: hypothetical protein ACKVOI_03405 [Dongiaceae bacterium]
MDVSGDDRIARAIQRLTIAVWAFVIVFAVYVCLYAAGTLSFTQSGNEAPRVSDLATGDWPEEVKEFFDASVEQKIREATVVVLARYQKDGSKLHCPISEILKHAPGIRFEFKVGDEFGWCNHEIEPGTEYGDGQIIYFQGNPARPRFATTFSGDRLNDMGSTPIELIREMVKADAK